MKDLEEQYSFVYGTLLSLVYQYKFPETISCREKGNLKRMIYAVFGTINKWRLLFPNNYFMAGFIMERTIFEIQRKINAIGVDVNQVVPRGVGAAQRLIFE